MAEDDITQIRVFGNDDESLKTLGQLLSNETSREIIHLLTHEEMYTNQISKKLGIQMNITIFHLKKLVELGLVIVTHKQIVKRGVDHKYYKMVPNMFVTSTQSKKEVHENGFLKKFFKPTIKFFMLGIILFSSWVGMTQDKLTKEITNAENVIFDNFSENATKIVTDPIIQNDLSAPIFIMSIIGICGLFLIWYSKK